MVWQLIIKLNIRLPFGSYIYLEKMKMYTHPQSRQQMSVAALFVTAKNWQQFNHPVAGKWID